MGGILGGLLSAGGGIISGIMGANASHDAMVNNYMISLLNYYNQQRQQFDAKMQADQITHKQDQGFTDAMGNRTHYVPGMGWVVDMSPASAGLQNAQVAEQAKEIGNDLSVKRDILNRNAGRQSGESDYANALLQAMRKQGTTDPNAVYYSLLGEGAKGVNRGFDDAQHGVSVDALRTRASNAGPILASMARERGDALADINMKARSQAMSLAPQLDAERKQNASNLYNLFATRASAMPDVSFAPPNVAQGTNASAIQAMDNGNLGASYQFTAANAKAPLFPYQPADYGRANAFGASLGSAGSAFNNYQMQQQYGQILAGLRGNKTQSNQGVFAE